MIKHAITSFFRTISSRLFILGAVFVCLSAVLVARVFHLQIVMGESYLNDYLYQTERTINIPSTRGNIYDCNGKPLAYNELVHSVVIADDGSQNNRELNETIYRAIKLIEKNGDIIVGDFPIAMDDNGDFTYTMTSDVSRLRFLADAYGLSNVADLDNDKETRSTKTAEEVFLYLCRRYNIQSRLSVLLMTDEDAQALGDQPVYRTEDALKILGIRYSLSSTSYRRYISVTMASDVNPATVAAIRECQAEIPGVTVEEETKRKYNDSIYLAHILGYTGRASQEDLEKLSKENPSYTSEDMVGKDGLEAYLETGLQGTKGSIHAYVNSQGTILDITEQTDPVAGSDYYLTIDSDLQKKMYDMFENYLAGILLKKIVNRDVVIKADMSASQRYISVKDVYYALFNNGIIDVSHFSAEDATDTEKAVYQLYCDKEDAILERMQEELLIKEKPLIYSKLDKEYQVYMSYTYSMLARAGVLLTGEIDTSDPTFRAWREDDAISLKEFLLYAISNGWIDTSKLDSKNKYSDMQEIYTSLVSYIEKRLRADTGFSKKIYRYMIEKYTINPAQICLLLFDQGVIEYNESDYERLQRGNSNTAFHFLMEKIKNIEITPAQLALDPCSGSVCVVDVNTGKTKALVIYPSYDNNKFSGYIDAEYWNKLANDESNAKPLYNRATMTETAPGSTFKMVSAAAALEEGVVELWERIYDAVVFDTVPPPVKCWSSVSHGRETVEDAIKNSCNYFFYEVGYRLSLSPSGIYTPELGNEKLRKYAAMFGLDSTSGIELSEAAPHISTEYPIQSAIGQGNNDFTNTQLARYVATVANGGTNRKLTLLEKRTDSEGNLEELYSAEITNIVELKDSTWNAIHQGMQRVVSEGSVRSIFKEIPFSVAGKTGTAQENPMRPNHAVFVGYAPCENPEIAVSVLIPNGFTSSYAAEIARNAFMLYYDLEDAQDSVTPSDTVVVD